METKNTSARWLAGELFAAHPGNGFPKIPNDVIGALGQRHSADVRSMKLKVKLIHAPATPEKESLANSLLSSFPNSPRPIST